MKKEQLNEIVNQSFAYAEDRLVSHAGEAYEVLVKKIENGWDAYFEKEGPKAITRADVLALWRIGADQKKNRTYEKANKAIEDYVNVHTESFIKRLEKISQSITNELLCSLALQLEITQTEVETMFQKVWLSNIVVVMPGDLRHGWMLYTLHDVFTPATIICLPPLSIMLLTSGITLAKATINPSFIFFVAKGNALQRIKWERERVLERCRELLRESKKEFMRILSETDLFRK